jgi:S-DNA-T family DNA segregation ATPase FtsK/SpoIIIE
MIGREHGCEVQLSDPMVSRYHARINITSVAEIIDLGSANGVQLGDAAVSRSVLRAGDTVRVGDSELAVSVTPAAPSGVDGAAVAFVRSPRLDPRYQGVQLDAPEPPQPRQTTRFPLIPLLAPLLMGGLLYLVTRSVTSLLFVALSPLMIVGYAAESMWAGRSEHKRAVRQFRTDLEDLTRSAEEAAETEAAARNREHPPLADCVEAVRRRDPLLWTRRPADPGFAELRLGIGQQPARNSIALTRNARGMRDLTAELNGLAERFATVDGVPVVATPAEHGAIGLAGPRPAALAAARGLLIQLAATHSPADAVLAGLASSPSCRDWDWLKWLPHTSSAHSPLPGRQLASNTAEAATLMSELEDLLEHRVSGDAPAQPAVFVLVEDDAPVERSRLVELAELGSTQGIHVLWLAEDTTLLPAACRTFVTVGQESSAGFVHSGARITPLTVELLDAGTAMEIARLMSPIVDSGARVDDDSDLPRSVSLLTIPEPSLAPAAAAVIERWTANRSILTGPYAPAERAKQAGTLRAVVGKSAAGAHAIDLRADGPHALVGGTTGSGKSELLQAWILAMAVSHSPQRLTFLLVDYKGGSAFRELESLPHTVGLFTDLSPHLVRRALVSLSAELRQREELLATHRVKDLVELERLGSTDAPPSLVIVVDEFAALVKELPEFVDGVVNVAQRGRSLGLHLILATQRPAGVIKENLRANTNLRIALRTADENDSLDVLGSPQAAFFDPALPGRAVSKTGPARLVPFQTGYAGGWTSDTPPPPELAVEELRFGAGSSWKLETAVDAPVNLGPTDISRMAGAIGQAAEHARLGRPRRPWLPELKTGYNQSNLAEVPSPRSDGQLVFAIRDDPAGQAQPPVAFRPDQDGNLAVFGTGGSGKSTLLRTMAIAAGFTVRGGPCHVYGLDFGVRGLAMLESLPHVGSIVSGADHERVVRLLTWLRQLIDDRAVRYSRVNAGTVTEYRTLAGAPDEARILVLLDGVAAFHKAYETGDRPKWFDMFIGIAADGRPVGVHVLLSADRPAAVPSALASAVQTRVVLRMADANDYAMMSLPPDVLTGSSPPGRGLLGGSEIQVAMLGSRSDVGSQAASVRAFAASMIRAGVAPAPPIQRLAERVPLTTLPDSLAGQPVLGVSSDTLGPLAFDPKGTFLICGPAGSGRTATLHAVAVALRRWDPGVELHYLGNRRSALSTMDLWTSTACGVDDVAERAKELATELAVSGPDRPVAVFLENVADFANTAADIPLQDLARVCVSEERLLVAEGETTTVSSGSTMGLVAQVKISRVGIALAPDSDVGPAFRTTFPPRLSRADFPPGRGLYVAAGRTTVVQVGLADTG